MALAISSLAEMWDCIPQSLYGVTLALGEIICSDIRPLADSVLIHTLFSALYTKLIAAAKAFEKSDTVPAPSTSETRSQTPATMTKSAICIMLAEASCGIDEDNKHTEAIEDLINRAKERQCTDVNLTNIEDENGAEALPIDQMTAPSPSSTQVPDEYDVESTEYIADVMTSDVLTTAVGKRCMKVGL